ncbi:hypothetical protein CY34DRAFT_803588 [Suillus luteus UH-Slu-Lm8-n1]|uniref:Unplaced genomic scaffold CY34scaffold_76, whole genome shotgun sequence n=1 Tax=Suillus luteus UH-Slu-Lm8-n1 TaxID=930992 RepID=A0A0D0B0X6_9AGAM|nr:hypothetical protein CY34DRAFT_803588 [Suillus luteus UH-Slu-Lm8-n1]
MASDSTGLPPLSSKGVFSVSASSLINAPREVVWDVLMDWKSYKEWNPFVRDQHITDARKNPLPDETPREGSYLYIHPVHIPPSFDNKWLPSSAFERITVLDHENYRTAWVNISTPHWLLNAERWQALVAVEGGKTRYETIEVFGGVLAYLIKAFVGSGLKKGFVAMAERLKSRAEERYEGHT